MKRLDEGRILSILGKHLSSTNYGQEVRFFTHVRNGKSSVRKNEMIEIDGLAVHVSWAKPTIIGFEVKTSRSDFLGDDKWHGYISAKMVTKMCLAAPSGLIKRSELPEQVGLVEIFEGDKIKWTKRPLVCNTEINPLMWQYIVYSKIESSMCPVHKREERISHFRDMLENRKEGSRLSGNLVGNLRNEARRLEEWEKSLKDRETELKDVKDSHKWLSEVFKAAGMNCYIAFKDLSISLEKLKSTLATKTISCQWDDKIKRLEFSNNRLIDALSSTYDEHKELSKLLVSAKAGAEQ